MAATTGFYGQSIFDSNRLINEMLQQDAMDKQRHQGGTTIYPPEFMAPSSIWKNSYPDKTPIAHYCEDVPKRLESYYQQLLDYHYQKDPSLRRETEKICCALKRLKIKYY